MKTSRFVPVIFICVIFALPAVAIGEEEQVVVAEDISPSSAHSMIEENLGNEDFVILDVRTPGEFRKGHIEGAENINYYGDDFRERIEGLDRKRTYLVYCITGKTSRHTLELMKELGFFRVYNLIGGITAWQDEGFPVMQ
jgi:rhodanese-related sulfurtransferase